MVLSRRKVLSLGGSLGLLSFSGCAGLPFGDQPLTLRLLNFDSQKHDLVVEILRAEASEQSEAVVLDKVYELQPPSGGDEVFEIVESDVLESRKYVVRAHLGNNHSVRRNYLFYPDCTENEEPPEELAIEIDRDNDTEEPFIRFLQNYCGSNSWQF